MIAAISKPRLQVYNNPNARGVDVRFRLPRGGSLSIGREFFAGGPCVGMVAALERARMHYERSNCRFLAQGVDDLIMQLFI